ncbi:MAG: Uma2 family endonuclease [Caldilineaceae bacterium]|nr:Uma2 family endonuclease [Caldilineaceae bacterium]
MAVAVAELISPQEYLELERKSETKHEYIAGRVIEMAGGSEKHNTIASNVLITLGFQLRGRLGKAYSSDMRVYVPATGLYTYPDVTAIADKPLLDDSERDILLNPTVIVEVLSDSTEQYDRGEKFQNYRTIDSLQEYIMIAQDSHRVEHYVRQSNGQWLFSEATSLEATIHLPSIDCELPLRDVYDKVEISASSASHPLNGHQG